MAKRTITLVGAFAVVALGVGLHNPLWTDTAGATKTLENAGYSHIKTEGYSLFGCGKGDFYRTEFTATGPNGKPVDGIVCKGIFKGSTIRFD